MLELRSVLEKDPLEQISPVQLGRLLRLLGRHRLLERYHVAPDSLAIDPDLLVPSKQQCPFSQRPPDQVEHLPQRGAGVLLVSLGPEQTQKLVAAVEARRNRD